MAGREPGDGVVPGGSEEPGDGESADPACRFPDEVWQRFLSDSESAIRASAPREPSARERVGGDAVTGAGTAGATTPPVMPPSPPPVSPPPAQLPGSCAGEPVGELWQRAESGSAPAWRELDRRGRLLRAGRLLVAAAAVATMVGVWSWLPSGSGTPSRHLRETAVRQTVEAPGERAATRTLPARLATARPSSATAGQDGRVRSGRRASQGARVTGG
ncbi:hypothetical protein ACIQU5_12330 [Streptomyces sp. NPDC090306]|uniref:hypothetical protein n=1 Tax=Streptomyces sp. NPDC090306 TaxID=3365961 RepID=UPI00382914F9